MRWLVTGGCGFIGSALVGRLRARGETVRVVDNLSLGTREALMPATVVERDVAELGDTWAPLELVVADIRDADAARAAAVGANAVVHLAANAGVMPSIEEPRQDCLVNVIGTFNYLDAARINGVPRFVFASSGAPLGEQDPPFHEEMVPKPTSPYGASKLAGEAYCGAFWRSFGVETVALRFGNVFGPGSGHKQSVVAKFLRRALAGEVLEVFGDGNQTRDFIYIDDIVEAIERAATRPGVGGEVVQIATQRESTVNEVAELIAECVRARTGRTVEIIHRAERQGEIKRNYADVSKARRILGFEPKVSLRKGLMMTLDYFEVATISAVM